MTPLTRKQVTAFQKTIYNYYHAHKRDLLWRHHITPYRIVVSEIMLQQTQVFRVTPKFQEFIKAFPTFKSLAEAPLSEVLRLWSGLGYYRRAKALKRIAEIVTQEYHGKLPDDPKILETFPGIGKATAASIVVYAFNKPYPFIETNIRTIFIHLFFKDREGIRDNDIWPLLEATMDRENPREWFYALMDYSLVLKKQFKNPSRRSAHYVRQSKFEGSNRQLRGKILKTLLTHSHATLVKISKLVEIEKQKVEPVLAQLVAEGFIKENRKKFSL